MLRRRTAPLCLAVALACPALAAASPGGAPSTPAPAIDSVKCKRECEGGVARAGSVLAVTGASLAAVESVVFEGATERPRGVSDKRLQVTVPRRAQTGPIVLVDGSGQESAPSATVVIEQIASPERTSAPIATAITGRRVFVDGLRRPTLSYRLQTRAPAEVTVRVVRQGSGRTVKTFEEGEVEPGSDQLVSFNGRRQGRYAFVVSAEGADGVSATTAQSRTPDSFQLLGHIFPIRGKHTYGDGFGAGRGHEGADVFARCGTPLVAARGGTVKIAKFHSRAGHYVVIDEAQSGVDSAYMHLRDPALVSKGDRVRTGQTIGHVGDTGSASGCHLHFERWSAPGWYTGGSPYDAMPELRAWDAVS